MKAKLLLAAALAGAALSSPVFAYTADAKKPVVTLPSVSKSVSPEGLSPLHKERVVRVALTINANGKASDIKIASPSDRNLREALIPALAQWEFTPATKDGKAVSARVLLPVQLVNKDS
jgi:TonB family protein